MTKRSKHRNERLLAWLLVVLLCTIVVAAIAFLVIRYKAPIKNFFVTTYNNVVYGKKVTEEPEVKDTQDPSEKVEPVQDEGTALDESSLDQIFHDEDEDSLPEIDSAAIISEEIYAKAESIMENMTLHQKVAQLFFITPEALTEVDAVTVVGQKTQSCFEEYPVGGLLLDEKNIEDVQQLKTMTGALQTMSNEKVSVPIFVGVDEDGSGNTNFSVEKEGFDYSVMPDPFENLLDIKSVEDCYLVANTTGANLTDYGFNINLEPQLNMPAASATEDDYKNQAAYVSAYIEGLHSMTVLGAPGAFPCATDISEENMVIDKDWSELGQSDLIPYERLINDGVKIIRVSHASIPQVTGEEIPACMSGILLTQNLRLGMGYDGIIMTNPMNEKVITDSYSPKEASVEALKAGVDMILLPEDFKAAYEGILEAVEDGTLSEQRIDESVKRLISTKLWLVSVNE